MMPVLQQHCLNLEVIPTQLEHRQVGGRFTDATLSPATDKAVEWPGVHILNNQIAYFIVCVGQKRERYEPTMFLLLDHMGHVP